MVSKEPNHLPSVQSHCNGNPEKAPTVVTVRSVLLNRNSPDIESRLKRRRSRTQQVRFKDLDNDSETWDSVEKVRSKSPNEAPNWQKEYSNGPSLVGAVRGDMEKTIGAVTAFIKRAPPHPLTPGPTRRSWVPTHPCSLTLPLPTQPCRSTAIQTSPSLQKPPLFSATQTRSHSLGGGWDDEDSSDELTAQVYVTPSRSRKKHDQCCTKKTENTDNVSISTTKTSSSPQKHSRRRGRRKPLSRAASDPGKREPACNSPTETVDKIPPESFHSTQVPSKDVKQESLNITSPQCTPNNNAGHNTCSISSKQPESRNCKVHTMPDSTASSQAVDVDHASSVTPSTAPLPQTSCLKESQCCPTESTCLTPTVPVSTSAQVMSAVAMPSTHEKTCSSPTKSTRICSTPSVRDCTSPKKPGSQSNPDPHSEPTPPVQSRNSFPVSEETTLSPKDTDSKPPNCSLEEPAIPITSSSITPHMKTLPKASSIASKEPVQPVIIPTQSVSPIQSVPNCNIPSQKEYVADSLDLPVHTLPTSTPVQPTTSCKFAQESLPRCTKENPVSFGSPKQPFTTQKTPTQIHPHNVIPFTPHSVTPNPFPMSTAAHIIPIAQTAVNYLFQNKSTNVTPCKPVLICNPSTQPAPCLPSSSLALQNSGMQNAVSCSSSPQVVHHVKAAAQTLSHSKSFPQNMSPILSQHEAKVHANKPQETVLPSANFRHSLPPYNPQNVLLFNNSGASPSPPQAFYYTQERRDRFILPPPPPPPPPYTPRKEGTSTPGQPRKPTVPKAASSITEKNGDKTAIEKSSSQAGTHRQVAETPPPIPPKTKARATVRPTCLSNQRAILGPGSQPNENHLAAAIGFNPQRPLGPAEGQGDTLRQVQELLGGLMSGAKCKLDLAKAKEKLFGPNGPLYDIGVLQSQLHSLEGVLETSQNTIKVLLDVIQDLEKKEAERDGRHTYRTGQDIENCGTCRDCACIIYSVEHDFRLQEGQVTKAWKVPEHQEAEQGSPQMVVPPPRLQEAPQALQSIKKSRRKCFWFL